MVKSPNFDRNYIGGRKMKYKSEILEVLHENAVEMYKIGGITEASMREYDEMCLSNPKTENKSASVYADDNSVNVEHISHAY
jgi:DNA-binding transcriptional regulator YiaG